MPELAEVELSRRIWEPALGARIERVSLHERCRVFRGTDVARLRSALEGSVLKESAAHGKQMIFAIAASRRKTPHAWMGIHLGMEGSLHLLERGAEPGKHDHLALHGRGQTLIFRDIRHFGRVILHEGAEAPSWWRDLPPVLTGTLFTRSLLEEFLTRRKRAPLKAVLLMQERFPGVGNWMADEILWRARLHPRRAAGSLSNAQQQTLWREVRHVCRDSLRKIAPDWSYPDTWLFPHRWKDGGDCPRCGMGLTRETVGGRTTCWCPRCQAH